MSSQTATCCHSKENLETLNWTQRVCLEQKGVLRPDYVEDKGEKRGVRGRVRVVGRQPGVPRPKLQILFSLTDS